MRFFLVALVCLIIGSGQALAGEAPVIRVVKSPTCGCCSAWIKHLEAEGFWVDAQNTDDMTPIKNAAGVPRELRSCHTASVDGYVIEGHVPAADIKRLLAERPDATGLSVPGMPTGSPGMEYGDEKEPYQVMLFGDGEVTVFSNH